jgi:hypothetical protein
MASGAERVGNDRFTRPLGAPRIPDDGANNLAEPDTTFEFALAALGQNEGDVSLSDFRKEVAAVEAALEAVDEDLHGRSQVEWIVKDLHHSQPTLQLAGYGRKEAVGEPGAAQRVLSTFFGGLDGLSKGIDNGELGNAALVAVRQLADPMGRSLKRAGFAWGDRVVAIDIEFRAALSKVQYQTEVRTEDWEGMLEEVNVHVTKPTFRLYPLAGPRWITCEFDRKELEKVRAAITKKVFVAGRALYRPHARFPHRFLVESLSPVEGDPDDLLQLGGSSLSEDHLERLASARHEWH